jgi:hypothetical protein
MMAWSPPAATSSMTSLRLRFRREEEDRESH